MWKSPRRSAAASRCGDITFVRGTVYKTAVPPDAPDAIRLPGFDKVSTSKELYAKSFYRQYRNTDPFTAKTLVEPYPRTTSPRAEPAADAAFDRGDGRGLRAAVRPHLSPRLRGSRRHPGHRGNQVQPDELPRLLRRVQLLRADLPSGAHHPGPQPRVPARGGAEDYGGSGLQGLHPRRRRPYGELPAAGLQKAAEARRLPGPTVPFPGARARISKSTTATTSRCSGSCARCRRSKRSLCAPASASIT